MSIREKYTQCNKRAEVIGREEGSVHCTQSREEKKVGDLSDVAVPQKNGSPIGQWLQFVLAASRRFAFHKGTPFGREVPQVIEYL